MISYQPSYDPYHAVFRIARLRGIIIECGPLERSKLRILDFYLAFPFLIQNIKLKSTDRGFRSISKRYEFLIPYADLPDSKVLFEKMELAHRSAVDGLVNLGWIRTDGQNGRIQFADGAPIPLTLIARIDELNADQSDLMGVLFSLGCEYRLLGAGGLKDRTGLMEYRYDTV